MNDGETSANGTEQLTHELYGEYNDHPHTTISLGFGQWQETVKQALEFRLGPPIAWEYDKGTLYLWGENLDESTLRNIVKACEELEQEHSRDGIYDAAEEARRAVSKISRAEVEHSVETGTDRSGGNDA